MPRKPIRLHSGRSIHGISPDIVSESFQTQNAGNHRPNIDTGSQGKLKIVLLVYFLESIEEINGE